MTIPVAERAWCVLVPHHARSAGQARWRLSSELAGMIRPELLADALAVVAELVGNAVRHATPLTGDLVRVAWRLRYAVSTEIVDIRVTDGGASTEPRLRLAELESIDGRGLAIVEALTSRWGSDRDGLGQCVWAELSGPVGSIGHFGSDPESWPIVA